MPNRSSVAGLWKELRAKSAGAGGQRARRNLSSQVIASAYRSRASAGIHWPEVDGSSADALPQSCQPVRRHVHASSSESDRRTSRRRATRIWVHPCWRSSPAGLPDQAKGLDEHSREVPPQLDSLDALLRTSATSLGLRRARVCPMFALPDDPSVATAIAPNASQSPRVRGPWRQALARFRRDPLGIVALVVDEPAPCCVGLRRANQQLDSVHAILSRAIPSKVVWA